jgi:THAP4-like, heme-binding beta-barrel domain
MNDVLARMEGKWSGEGRGGVPTIDPFIHRETLTIEQRDETSLFFVQKSVRTTPAGTAWVTSHWESGFIRQLENDTFDLASAQSGGRTEVLRGTVTISGPRLVVDFVSTAISNDPRVIASARRWEVARATRFATRWRWARLVSHRFPPTSPPC